MVWDWSAEGNIEGNNHKWKKPKVRTTRCIILELNQSTKRKKWPHIAGEAISALIASSFRRKCSIWYILVDSHVPCSYTTEKLPKGQEGMARAPRDSIFIVTIPGWGYCIPKAKSKRCPTEALKAIQTSQALQQKMLQLINFCPSIQNPTIQSILISGIPPP